MPRNQTRPNKPSLSLDNIGYFRAWVGLTRWFNHDVRLDAIGRVVFQFWIKPVFSALKYFVPRRILGPRGYNSLVEFTIKIPISLVKSARFVGPTSFTTSHFIRIAKSKRWVGIRIPSGIPSNCTPLARKFMVAGVITRVTLQDDLCRLQSREKL